MRIVALLFISLLLLVHVASAETVITIEVLENGTAMWTTEKRLPLTNQTEIGDWEEFVSMGENTDQDGKDIADFRDRIDWFISSAEKFSNRSMEAKNFNISYGTTKTLAGVFSIISYTFEWKNFSRVDSSNIFIGDAFSEGMVLSQDNVLIIKIPENYEVETVSPAFDLRDGNRLIWDGRMFRSFGRGEPSITLSKKGRFTWYIIGIVMFSLASGTSLILWKKRQTRDFGDKIHDPTPPEINALTTGASQIAGTEIQPSHQEDLTLVLSEIDLGDEEMIENLLHKSGGQAYQSDIVKESGFSKSKISIVLAKMKEDGRIIKIKKGKENIIRLIKK
ncbi:MAG: hypothetical protein O8C66_12635 [Candidatus Methanoperedens sp.]|nr:hypothetical protein [Candidatus Methanoperedens sp.]MCZ7371346.1 hypothetical protein [Candidatus Methanoperedens sp.]